MGQDIEKKILRIYFENPGKTFTVRNMSKLTRIPRSSVHKKLFEMKTKNILNKENSLQDNGLIKIKKINYFVEEIFESGLIEFLTDKLNPSCIILFGSIRKGESDKNSDIDIFVESSVKKKLDLAKFEKKIGHKIDLFVESKITNLQDNLFNNVINGIKLFGSFKVK